MRRIIALTLLSMFFFTFSAATVDAEITNKGDVIKTKKHSHQSIKKRKDSEIKFLFNDAEDGQEVENKSENKDVENSDSSAIDAISKDVLSSDAKTSNEEKNKVDRNKPMIALTFDDGPSKVTLEFIKIFNENGARATFFIVGNRLEANKKYAKAIQEQGHEIGSHSWDHSNFLKLDAAGIDEQLTKTNEAIKSITGEDTKLLRPPYGNVSDSVKEATKKQGMAIVNWSVDPEDWKTRNADAIYEAILKDAKDGSIILCHDLYSETAEAMKRVVPELIKRGYQLVTVSELIESTNVGFVAGKVYSRK